MTKIQRQKHITLINTTLLAAGATLDRWGTYRLGEYKFDTRETNLKIYKNKDKISSKPMVQITIEELQAYLIKIKK